jgi:pimeloyl-ACP methyl ester carboxylesterase
MLRVTHPRLCLIALLYCLGPATGIGRAQVATDPLRAELERVRASHPAGIDGSVFDSIAYQIDVADRIAKDYAAQSQVWRGRAAAWLKTAAQGNDPVLGARGQIVMRSYNSPISRIRQGYGIYLPKNYDPARAYPLMLVLHGGSANGNLFLGVVLGNNMNWKEYDKHLWDEFAPRFEPDWIVVAPDGFGQVMWRFMGEQDVLDVLADVQKHYHVDADRVVLCGLSNGGVGAYSMGMRHAWRFSAVLAIAGAPSWLKYAGDKMDALQAEGLHPLSAMSLAENAINTDFRYYHGHSDPGPMRPAYVAEFSKQIATLGVPYSEKWFDAGHDLLYLVHRHGRIFSELEGVVRNRHPKEVRIVTGDYRANRQHWVSVTRIERLPELARVRAVANNAQLSIETRNTQALSIAWRDAPLGDADQLTVTIDGTELYKGSRKSLPDPLQLSRDGTQWRIGTNAAVPNQLEKVAGSSGPITDAYFGSLVHVYGTLDPALAPQLRRSAERGARGWPLWLWRVDQPVLADTEVTDQIMRDNDLVLYGTPGSNSLLNRAAASLPIRIETDAIVAGEQRWNAPGVGTKFIYPSPLAKGRYVIVQAAPSIDGVNGGHNLPDFLPDYVVYDAKSTRSRPRLLFPAGTKPLALGYFDSHWRLDPTHTQAALANRGVLPKAKVAAARVNEGNGPESADHDVPKSRLPVPACPPLPPVPSQYSTAPNTQAGKAAREIARRVAMFTNYRGKIPGATWTIDAASMWSIREQDACLAALAERDVKVEAWTGPLPSPVATPVRVQAAVGGVNFRFMHAAAGVVISCELAERLLDIAKVVEVHGVHTVYVLSAYRDHPFPSFHTLGLALDLSRFDTPSGALTVKTDFVIDRNHETCDPAVAAPANEKARTLRAIACELAASHRFSSVLTPNYNAGHRDHFHLDIRPDDPRLFLR